MAQDSIIVSSFNSLSQAGIPELEYAANEIFKAVDGDTNKVLEMSAKAYRMGKFSEKLTALLKPSAGQYMREQLEGNGVDTCDLIPGVQFKSTQSHSWDYSNDAEWDKLNMEVSDLQAKLDEAKSKLKARESFLQKQYKRVGEASGVSVVHSYKSFEIKLL